MPIPLQGQGTPLPACFPYRGAWILQPRLFLYCPAVGEEAILEKPQFTAEVNPTGDDWSVGFDATALAKLLGVTPETLFDCNRRQQLTLENVEPDAAGCQDCRLKRYIFVLAGRLAVVEIGRFSAVGRG